MQPLKKTKLVILQGEMVEWSITTVLKTVVPRGTGGSNPSLSAQSPVSRKIYRTFFVLLSSPPLPPYKAVSYVAFTILGVVLKESPIWSGAVRSFFKDKPDILKNVMPFFFINAWSLYFFKFSSHLLNSSR